MGSSSRSTSAGATSCWARPSRPRSPPLKLGQRPGARLVGIEAEAVRAPRRCGRRSCSRPRDRSARDRGRTGPASGACSDRPPPRAPWPAPPASARARAARRTRPAAASQTVVAPPNSRCCSMTEIAETARPRDRAGGRLGLAGDEAEQRGLAGAVAADDAPPLTPRHGERDVAQQTGGAELHGDAGDGELGHRPVQSRQVGLGVADRELLLMADERASGAAAAPRRASRASGRRSGAPRRVRDRRSGATRGRPAPATPNFCAKRRSSPGEAARSCRSTKWVLMRRSAKKRSAFRVSGLFRMPKIWTSMGRESTPATRARCLPRPGARCPRAPHSGRTTPCRPSDGTWPGCGAAPGHARRWPDRWW